jgi:hypothetical protein
MERLDRSTLLTAAVAIALGFALWQLLGAIGYTTADLLIEWWDDGETLGPFGADFSVGGATVEYGQLLQALVSLLVAVVVAVPTVRYIARRRAPESHP